VKGTQASRLIVLRGNSGSSKTTAARALRERFGRRLAWVEQDYLRRVVLKELDAPGGVNIGLIEQTVLYALAHGYIVVLEGILNTGRYGEMLERLASTSQAHFFYFQLSFGETVRRHATRPQASEFTPDTMREWYRPADLLPFVPERVFDETLSLEDVVKVIVETSGLGERALTPLLCSAPLPEGEG
jgi:hypothetical protein